MAESFRETVGGILLRIKTINWGMLLRNQIFAAPRRCRIGGPLRRSHPRQQRAGPLRSPRPPDRQGGPEPPGRQCPEPAGGQAANQRIGCFTGIVRYGSLRHRRAWRRSGPRGPTCPLQKGLAQATLMPYTRNRLTPGRRNASEAPGVSQRINLLWPFRPRRRGLRHLCNLEMSPQNRAESLFPCSIKS